MAPDEVAAIVAKFEARIGNLEDEVRDLRAAQRRDRAPLLSEAHDVAYRLSGAARELLRAHYEDLPRVAQAVRGAAQQALSLADQIDGQATLEGREATR